MQRTLGGFETAAVLTGEAHAFNLVVVLRLATGVPSERLEHALATLQRRHALLAVRVVGDGRRYRFVDGAPAPPLDIVERHGGSAWRQVAEEELDRPIDLAVGPPIRCVYLPPAGRGGNCEIILTLHHAVVDGASSAPFLTELVSLCAGSPAPVALETGIPPPAEALFPSRYRDLRSRLGRLAFLLRQLADEARYRFRRQDSPARPSEAKARCGILPLALPEQATTRLVRRSRRERATLNGALNAALLIAVQRHLYDGLPGPMRYFAFTDLRPYLSPVPPPTTLAAYVAGLRFTIPMPENASFWPLAREVSQQIAAAGRRGERFHAAKLMPATIRAVLRSTNARMATVALSYTGAVRFAQKNGALRIRGLHAFVSNLPQGPEFTASVKLVEERLAWDIVYLDTDMSATLAKKLAGEIVRTLVREARDGGS